MAGREGSGAPKWRTPDRGGPKEQKMSQKLMRVLGVLATEAKMASGLYHRACGRCGIEVVGPDPAGQRVVNRAIYGVKAGQMGPEVTQGLVRVATHLLAQGAQAVVLGCTELPYVMKPHDLQIPLLGSNLVLARAAVRLATGTPQHASTR